MYYTLADFAVKEKKGIPQFRIPFRALRRLDRSLLVELLFVFLFNLYKNAHIRKIRMFYIFTINWLVF